MEAKTTKGQQSNFWLNWNYRPMSSRLGRSESLKIHGDRSPRSHSVNPSNHSDRSPRSHSVNPSSQGDRSPRSHSVNPGSHTDRSPRSHSVNPVSHSDRSPRSQSVNPGSHTDNGSPSHPRSQPVSHGSHSDRGPPSHHRSQSVSTGSPSLPTHPPSQQVNPSSHSLRRVPTKAAQEMDKLAQRMKYRSCPCQMDDNNVSDFLYLPQELHIGLPIYRHFLKYRLSIKVRTDKIPWSIISFGKIWALNISLISRRMCCSFYQNLPISESHYTGYPGIALTLLSNKYLFKSRC